jgi:hypothetical protein
VGTTRGVGRPRPSSLSARAGSGAALHVLWEPGAADRLRRPGGRGEILVATATIWPHQHPFGVNIPTCSMAAATRSGVGMKERNGRPAYGSLGSLHISVSSGQPAFRSIDRVGHDVLASMSLEIVPAALAPFGGRARRNAVLVG